MILNRLRNVIQDRTDSENRCLRCRQSWQQRDPKRIRYHRDGSKAAPLCTQCFDEVDHIIATRYFCYLWSEVWGRSRADSEFHGCRRTFMQYAIFDALERGEKAQIDPSNAMEMREWAPSMTLGEAKGVLEGQDIL